MAAGPINLKIESASPGEALAREVRRLALPHRFYVRRGEHLALDTGGGAFARRFSTALAGLVDMDGYVKASGDSVKTHLPKTALKPAVDFEWKAPRWSNADR